MSTTIVVFSLGFFVFVVLLAAFLLSSKKGTTLKLMNVPGPFKDVKPSKMAMGIMPNWWGSTNDPKLDPMDVVDKLGFVPYLFGTFVDIQPGFGVNEQDLLSYADKVLAVKNRHGSNPWNLPFTLDVAVLPHGGLNLITDDLILKFAQAFKKINDKGISIRTRFWHEGNGDWYTGYSQRPDETKKLMVKWYQTIKSIAGNVDIQFNPNFNFRECGSLFDPELYWPGPEYIDSVGTDVYFQYEGKCDEMLNGNEIYETINKCGFYDKFCKAYNKPMWIAETSRSWKKDARCPQANNIDAELAEKQKWWKQLMDPRLGEQYPLIKGFNWFNFRKNESGEDRDFRITHDMKIANQFRQDLFA